MRCFSSIPQMDSVDHIKNKFVWITEFTTIALNDVLWNTYQLQESFQSKCFIHFSFPTGVRRTCFASMFLCHEVSWPVSKLVRYCNMLWRHHGAVFALIVRRGWTSSVLTSLLDQYKLMQPQLFPFGQTHILISYNILEFYRRNIYTNSIEFTNLLLRHWYKHKDRNKLILILFSFVELRHRGNCMFFFGN